MPPTFHQRWLMFLLRPADLLRLLQMVSNPLSQFASGALPPDVRIEDTFYDEGPGYLGLMLESELFEPVEIKREGEMLSASWPRAVFNLENNPWSEAGWSEPLPPTALPDAPAPPFGEALRDAATRDFPLRALTFASSDLLRILRASSARELPLFPTYPVETRVIGAIAPEGRGVWILFLEHPDFEPCRVGQENDLVYLEIPDDGENGRLFRISLPGATIKRRLDLNFD